jgi:uncharacterized protein YegP (UPF0339 family)
MKKRNCPKEFYQRLDGKWEWRIKSSNGNIIATSGGQGYNRRVDAEDSFETLKRAFVEGRVV